MQVTTGAPGLIIAAPSSGSGKTTVTLGLLAALKAAGHKVRGAKVGPDYIDPRYHEAATGHPSINLDGWAMGAERLAGLIEDQAVGADLLVVEGVMGLFDGAAASGVSDNGSTASLATATGWPVVLVIDAARQAQSVGALVQGFANFRTDVEVAGVILNKVASDRHEAMLRTALDSINMPVFGCLPRSSGVMSEDRHLGLVQAGERLDLAQLIATAADWAGAGIDLDAVIASARPSRLATTQAVRSIPPLGQRVAIAEDIAFGFSYPHLLADWRRAGAELLMFSPLADDAPNKTADAVYLPGGYPELHAARLAANSHFLGGLRSAAEDSLPIYGECGGYMVLGEALCDAKGVSHQMAGLLAVETSFAQPRLSLGYRQFTATEATPFGPAGSRYRGHEFHYATIVGEAEDNPIFVTSDAAGRKLGAVGRCRGSVFGSFLHLIDLD
jgi:cobyrinic acid a,c-diamide synthase